MAARLAASLALSPPVAPRGARRSRRPSSRKGARVLTRAAGKSFLSDVEQAPPDPILGVSVAFRECQNPNKLNLGVGAYRTEALEPYVLDVVKRAETMMLAAGHDKEYLPMQGLAEFNAATVELLLGKDSEAVRDDRVATCLLYTSPSPRDS